MKRRGHENRRQEEHARGEKPWQSIRPSKVARAKQLIQKSDYPSEKVVESVAALIAKNLEKR